ncbi:MAG: ribonuclease HII [Bacteroidota bacterium]
MSLSLRATSQLLEAGVDEAGRGCLAGPVVAAAVILPEDADIPGLNDSKKLNHSQRMALRPLVEDQALAWGVGIIGPERIDEINILNATYEAMHQAIGKLRVVPVQLNIDGNRFRPYPEIPHLCQIKGDGRFLNIAAASILAKTYRDEMMEALHEEFPQYAWDSNKGYPTKAHRAAIAEHGPTEHHRMSFRLQKQLELF